MTYFKTKLIAATATLAFAVSPALANHHEGNMKNADHSMMKKDHMDMDSKKMKWKAMSASERQGKLQNMSVEEHMKWKAMSDADKKTMMSWMSDDEKMMFKTAMKKHNMNHHDGMMKSDSMMKTGSMMSTSMTAEQRMAAEKRIISGMSEADRKAYMAMAPKARKAMMNKRLTGDYMVDKGTMMDAPMNSGMVKSMTAQETIGEVMQDDARNGTTERRAIAVPTVGSNIATTVNCPAGTTAQANGTCLITGNYQY